jgi:hypothetical protein
LRDNTNEPCPHCIRKAVLLIAACCPCPEELIKVTLQVGGNKLLAKLGTELGAEVEQKLLNFAFELFAVEKDPADVEAC